MNDEFPTEAEAPLELIQGQILSQCQVKSIKERMRAVDALLANSDFLPEIAHVFPQLLKESNAIIQQKLLQILVIAIERGLVQNTSQVLRSLAENCLGGTKPLLREAVFRAIEILSQLPDFDFDPLIGQLAAKNARICLDAAQALSAAMLVSGRDPRQIVSACVPGLVHNNGTVRKPFVEVLVHLAGRCPAGEIAHILEKAGVQQTVLQSFEAALQIAQPEVVHETAVNRATELPPHVRYQSPAACAVTVVALPKNFEEEMAKDPDPKINAQKWKAKKVILDALYLEFYNAEAAKCGFDLGSFVTNMRMIILEELNVVVVGLVYRLLGIISIKTGSLGPMSGVRQLLQVAMGRVKERKYAITQGYQIFSQSIIVRMIHLKDLLIEYLQVAISHKNPEVREDLCRYLKSLYSTSICYCFSQQDEQNEKIKVLNNDSFPNPTFLTTGEVIPEEGERSYGMQLNTKILRQRSVNGSIFASLFIDGILNEQPVIFVDQIIAFANAFDKILSDMQDVVRQLAKRAFSLFVIAHLSEAYDALQRSGKNLTFTDIYNQMFTLMFDIIHQHKRRNELLQMISSMLQYAQISVFQQFFEQMNFGVREVQQLPEIQQIPQPQLQKQVLQKATGNLQNRTPEFYYKQRASNQLKFVVDPNNQQSPVSKSCVEEFFQQLSLSFGPQLAQQMFVKGNGLGTIPAVGSVKTLTDAVKQLISVNRQSNDNLYHRDLILRYSNLLLCDGFVAKQSASPAMVKLALDLTESVIFMMQQSGKRFNQYDIECGMLVLFGRFEQQNTAIAKQQVLKVSEDFIYQCEKCSEVVEFILQNFIGKGVRYQIRQAPTKQSIIKVCLGVAIHVVQQGFTFENINVALIQNLINQLQMSTVDLIQTTENSFTLNIPLKLSQSRTVVIYLFQIIYNYCSPEIRQKIVLIIQKQCAGEYLNIISPVTYINQDELQNKDQALNQVDDPLQIQEKQDIQVQQDNTLNVDDLNIQVEKKITKQITLNYDPSNQQSILNHQALNVQSTYPINHFEMMDTQKIQPTILKKSVTKIPQRRVTFINEEVEQVELLTFTKTEPKTPRLDEKLKLDSKISAMLTDLMNPNLLQLPKIYFAITYFKIFITEVRERTLNRMKIESEIQRIIKQVSNIFRAHINDQTYQMVCEPYTKLIKYYCILQAELFKSDLADHEPLIRCAIEDLIFASAVFSNPLNQSANVRGLGLIQGTILSILSQISAAKAYCSILQIQAQFVLAHSNMHNQGQQLQFIVLQNVSNFMITSQLQQAVFDCVGLYFTKSLQIEANIREAEALDVFDQSDLQQQQELRGNWMALEKDYPDFCKQISINKPSHVETALFCAHLFLLKARDMTYKRNQYESPEIVLVKRMIKNFKSVIGNKIYLFLQKIPRVKGVEIRSLLE